MEILDQIEGRIKQAMQTIEDLQSRVRDLETEKALYEEKLAGLLQQMDSIGETGAFDAGSNDEASSSENSLEHDGHHHEHHHF